jgi:putative NADPH-quinone reductase
MRVLVIHAHPVETSYNAALARAACAALSRAGHEVDLLDLYAEGFEAAMSREERLDYHDRARAPPAIAALAERLARAQGIVFIYPVWSFGMPAILKGWFDRVLRPGIAFNLKPNGRAEFLLTHVRALAAVATYGQGWAVVRLAIGDLPRAQVMRLFRRYCAPDVRARYHALYAMNRRGQGERERFLAAVETAMARFG